MDAQDDGAGAAPVLFKRKTKARGGLGGASAAGRSSSAATTSRSTSHLHSAAGDDEDDEDAPIAVVRTKGLRGRATQNAAPISSSSTRRDAKNSAARPQASTSTLSFGDEEASAGNDLARAAGGSKRSALAFQPGKLASLGSQADISDDSGTHRAPPAASLYDAASLAELKAATSSRRGPDQSVGSSQAYTTLTDPTMQVDESGESLARMKFGADFAHDAIPSEAVIAAAKEKRRRGLAGTTADDGADDFIPLNESNALSTHRREPHPESRLQREEDEEGSGEDEYAAYTGAQDRVALGRDARDVAKREQRMQMREAMELDGDGNASDASDDSAQEWEAAQMQRMHIHNNDERKQRSKREKSPYRPAPIPRTAPLPQLGSTSIRLRARLQELQEAAKSHDMVVQDAEKQLAQLLDDEKRNKADTETTADKESWFREFQDFILTVARFLESKVPRMASAEEAWRSVLRERLAATRSARFLALEDDIALIHGVPSISRPTESGRDVGSDLGRTPAQDGDALSFIRNERRQRLQDGDDPLSGNISAQDQDVFYDGRDDVRKQVDAIMDDVQAPEFEDPAARIEREDSTRSLHPASIVARFHRWRRLYPEEYGNAWGGLTLAGVWDYWIRRELCGFDFFTLPSGFSFDNFNWFVEITHYAERSQQHHHQHKGSVNGDGDADTGAGMDEHHEPIGGDDEIVAHAFTNTFLPLFTRQIEEGALDVWNTPQNRSTLEVAEQVSYVLEKDNVAFQSLVGAVLNKFQEEIDFYVKVLAMPPAIPPPSPAQANGLVNTALRRTLHALSTLLLRNLLLWHRFVGPAQRPQLVDLATNLVGHIIAPLLERLATESRRSVSAGEAPVDTDAFFASTASDILQRCARPAVLRDDAIRARLSAMAGQPPPA